MTMKSTDNHWNREADKLIALAAKAPVQLADVSQADYPHFADMPENYYESIKAAALARQALFDLNNAGKGKY